MGIVSLLAVYAVIWAIVLQAVLPFGVKTQAEADDIAEGTVPSAPVRPHWKAKLLAATLISAALLGLFYWVYEKTGLGMR